jgi:hypothetical protein
VKGIASGSKICPDVQLNVKMRWPVKSCRSSHRVQGLESNLDF